MNVNGNNYNLTNNSLYNRYSAFSKPSGDKDIASDKSSGWTDSVIYDKGSETSSKIYTSGGTLQGPTTSTSKSKYSAQEILDEIDKYTSAGQIYAIWSNGKEHTVLSLGGALSVGILGNSSYDKEAADYVDFWNCLNKKNPSGIATKFSNEEIRSRLANAGIQSGFFTVTVGGRIATHYLSQGKNTAAVHSKEQYDERYDRMTSGRFFKQFQAGQKVTVGGKEYVLGEDKKLDIKYGADIFDLHAQAPESMREA